MEKKIIEEDLIRIGDMGIQITKKGIEIGVYSTDNKLIQGIIFSNENISIQFKNDDNSNVFLRLKNNLIETGIFENELITGFAYDDKLSFISEKKKKIDIDFRNKKLHYLTGGLTGKNFCIKALINISFDDLFFSLTNLRFIDDLSSLEIKEDFANVIALNDNFKICYFYDEDNAYFTIFENEKRILTVFEDYASFQNDFSVCLTDKIILFPDGTIMSLGESFVIKKNKTENIYFKNGVFISKKSDKLIDIIDTKEEYANKYKIVEEANISEISSNSMLSKESLDNPEKELDELIGLENVKKQIKRYKNYYLSSKSNDNPLNLHMVFSGNPGTGKTTVARIIANIFYKEGILPTNNLIEGSRETLVGEYIGHTAAKTNVAVQNAMGGVLFIDEAYTLGYGGERDFGKEAIDELIKSMEEYKGQFCLILAGYSDEMEKLFNVNMGLKSRIQKNVLFEDYNYEELGKIFDRMLTKESYECEKSARDMIIKDIYGKRNLKNYSNAREVRIAIENLLVIQSERTFADDMDRLIRVCDVEKYINENKITNEKTILKCPVIPYEKLIKYSSKEMSLSNDFEDYIESIIALRIFANNEIKEATGFIVSPEGYAITCAHCVKDAYKIEARRRIKDRRGNQVETYHNCAIALINNNQDLAVIKLENRNTNIFPYVTFPVTKYKPLALSTVYEMGYPLGASEMDNLSLHKGYISSSQIIGNHNRYILDIVATYGASGSCIIGENGKVIGMLQGGIENERTGFVVAIPYYYILDAIKKQVK